MPSGSADRRYAQAVFELARESNCLDEWASDLVVIQQVFSDRSIAARLENPKVPPESKIDLVSSILKDKVSPTSVNLALLLVKRSRQAYIGGISNEYTRLVNQLRGIGVAEVTTAVPINDEEEKLISQRLSQITGKQIQLKKKVDPAIIGGLIARVGDTLLDGSVTSSLQELRKSLA